MFGNLQNSSYHLIIFINILQLHKEWYRHDTWDVSVILAFLLLSFREIISYNMSVYFSIHNIGINSFSLRRIIHYSALILLGGLAFNMFTVVYNLWKYYRRALKSSGSNVTRLDILELVFFQVWYKREHENLWAVLRYKKKRKKKNRQYNG